MSDYLQPTNGNANIGGSPTDGIGNVNAGGTNGNATNGIGNGNAGNGIGNGAAPTPIDAFSDLSALRLDQSYADIVGVKKLLMTVPVRNPTRRSLCARTQSSGSRARRSSN